MSPRHAIRQGAHWLSIAAGLVLLTTLGFLMSMGDMGMRTVVPTAPAYGLVTQRLYGDAYLWRDIGAIALGVLLVTGLPRGRTSSDVPEGLAQGFGGVVLAAAAIVGVVVGDLFYFASPEDVCVRSGCWPLPAQSAAAILPALVTAAVMITLAARWRRVPWWVRWATPALVWVGLAGLQLATWDRAVLPYLTAATG